MRRLIKLLSLSLTAGILLTTIGCNNSTQNPRFVMTAKITAISHVIEVEILDDQYNQGVMWVNHSNATAFCDQNGKKISASQLKVGDVIEISYSG